MDINNITTTKSTDINNKYIYPRGWYRLFSSREISRGQVKSIACLNEELIVFRGENGIVTTLNAICPHLGANIGHGGKVSKNCVQCPFHGWKFDTSGQCVEIPYARCEGIPKTATLRAWPTKEANGCIYFWYSSSESSPSECSPWEIHTLDTKLLQVYHGREKHTVTCEIQEIPENGADIAHFSAVHSGFAFLQNSCFSRLFTHDFRGSWKARPRHSTEAHVADIEIIQVLKLWGFSCPLTKLVVKIIQDGPANVLMHFHSYFGQVAIVQSVLPLQPKLQLVTEEVYSSSRSNRWFAKILLRGTSNQIRQDIAIWNHKKYLKKPLIIKSDGPLLQFRRWMSQFYPKQHINVEHTQ